MLNEISSIAPENTTPEEWEEPFDSLNSQLIECCRRVDPESTDEALQEMTERKANPGKGRRS